MVHKRAVREAENVIIPYADDVTFYADPNTKEIMHVQTKWIGKGWYAIYVNGRLVKKTRNPSYSAPSNFKKVSLFSETSYHSGLNVRGKITRYGTHNYNLQYSSFKPIGNYKLKSPIKTQLVKKFGKKINTLTLQKWNSIVLNWMPEGNTTKLQIQHSRSTPYDPVGQDKSIYKSRKYDLSEKGQAIKDFKKYVERNK